MATYDGVVAKLYVDGKLDGSLPAGVGPVQNDDPILLGRRVDGFSNYALLAEVAIYPTALWAERIAAHWGAASSKP